MARKKKPADAPLHQILHTCLAGAQDDQAALDEAEEKEIRELIDVLEIHGIKSASQLEGLLAYGSDD